MRDGFIKVATVSPDIRVADTVYNGNQICDEIHKAQESGARIIVFPELAITGYTCGDLFYQRTLLESAKEQLLRIAQHTLMIDGIVFVGLPISYDGKLYNVAAAISQGKILGLVPKTHLPNYHEFYEKRYFATGMKQTVSVDIGQGADVLMGTDLIFTCMQDRRLQIGVELCEDLWAPNPPSISHAMSGATLIVNLSASDAVTGKSTYRRQLIAGQSARLICGYLYASAGSGESTQDVVYSGAQMIAENGTILAEREYESGILFSEIDLERIDSERRQMNTFHIEKQAYAEVMFHLETKDTILTRHIDAMPFVPGDKEERTARCLEIFQIQALGLKKRLEHTNSKQVVIGISGGLDSTLALLVAVEAFDRLNLDRSGIIAVTMPGFGTTDRTYDNAVSLVKELNATLKEISIVNAVTGHFADIEHDPSVHDITYENCQARERTQILMDLANKYNGLVIGTGDMSELALGWATYNGDHMSMYGVNSSVPKTLVRYLVEFYAEISEVEALKTVLMDILATPVSPELLPPSEGQISQKTEDIVGPYELHDFFLYYLLRFGYTPGKIYRLAQEAFQTGYEKEIILKWLKIFYRRFFSQHFKRSCLPDGPKVGSVAVSPRGDLRMPSDASASIWLQELDRL